MRTVTCGGAVSLDGFLAGANGAIEWLHFSKDIQDVMKDYWKDVDTIFMGRKTYEVAVARRSAREKKSKEDQETCRASHTHLYLFAHAASHRRPQRRISHDGRSPVCARSQTPTERVHLPHGRWRARAITPGRWPDRSDRPQHSPNTARLRHPHVSRSGTPRQPNAYRMPHARWRVQVLHAQ